MKFFLTLAVLAMLLLVGITDATAKQDDTCTPSAVVSTFAQAEATDSLDEWLDGYKSGSCPATIKAGAQALYNAYKKMPKATASEDQCKGKPVLCNLFANAEQFMDSKPDVFAGGGGKVTHKFTKDCARNGATGLMLTYDTAGDGQYGGFVVNWAKSKTGIVDLSGYTTFSVWAMAVSDEASFQIGLLDSVLKSGNEPRVETADWLPIDNSEWVEITFPMEEFNDASKIIKFSEIRNLSFGFNTNHGAGQVCIDDVAFIP